MFVFLLTVGIGILNGLDLIEFEHDTLMTHVHAGTLGWITLSVFAFTLWLMGQEESVLGRGSAVLAAVSVPIYAVAFWVGNAVFTRWPGAPCSWPSSGSPPSRSPRTPDRRRSRLTWRPWPPSSP
ncbi:MAG: hypothetical protein HYU54_01335 [Actinobacteria bacterium]|nr:hypothetical protein [Actinomycetota bacterium]